MPDEMRAIVVAAQVVTTVGSLFGMCPSCGVVQRFVYGQPNTCPVCKVTFKLDEENLQWEKND